MAASEEPHLPGGKDGEDPHLLGGDEGEESHLLGGDKGGKDELGGTEERPKKMGKKRQRLVVVERKRRKKEVGREEFKEDGEEPAQEGIEENKGSRGFHATGVRKMGAHAHDEPYYLHAKHMYNLHRMKHQKLKASVSVMAAVGIGIAVPMYAVVFQQKKTASA